MFIIAELRQICAYEKILFGLSLLAYLLILNEMKLCFVLLGCGEKKAVALPTSSFLVFCLKSTEKYRPAQKRKSNLSLLIVKKDQMSHILIFNTVDLPFRPVSVVV